MRNILFAAVTLAGLISGTAAMADEFGGPARTDQAQAGAVAQLDHQTVASQFADPTASNSLRSHGHP